MVIIRIWEGLGNQMFQYAYARALKSKGLNVKLDMDKSYDDMFIKYGNHDSRENAIHNFRITLPLINLHDYRKYEYLNQDTIIKKGVYLLGTHHLWKYKFYEEETQEYSAKMERIKGEFYIKGWFQSEKYFKNIRSILLREFVPKRKIKISKELKNALEDPENVSLHVRRGDYVRIRHALNLSYYEKAVNYIKQIYKNPFFLVFSDDLEWAKNNILLNDRCIYVNEDNTFQDFEELFIMSKCKANIISNSTFSWWAAWLNQNQKKIVIAPKNWMKGQGDIVLDQWVVL